MNIKNIRKITLTISILIHFFFLLSYKTLSNFHLFRTDNLENKVAEQEKRIAFELVETPDDSESEQPPKDTNLLSDKNSIAKDRNIEKNNEPGLPYSQGETELKNFELRDLQIGNEQQDQLVFNDIEQTDNNEFQQERGLSSRSYESAKFSRQALLGKSNQTQRYLSRSKYNNRKFNAEEIGGLTFNTYEWNFAPYLFEMKRKVERNIFPPPAFTHMGLIHGRTVIRFKVMPNGEVKDIKVLKYEGHKSLMETSVKAIQNSSPFKPLPADFPENYLEVTATFMYDIMRK